ncbi:MAG: hypothetical protein ACFCD0_11035 [Gemmataceae bacterium]
MQVRQEAIRHKIVFVVGIVAIVVAGCPNKPLPNQPPILVEGKSPVDPITQKPLRSEISIYEFAEPRKTDVGTSFAASRYVRGKTSVYYIRFRDQQRFLDVPEAEAQRLLALYKKLNGLPMPTGKILERSLVLWKYDTWWVRYELDGRRWQQGTPPTSTLSQIEIKSPRIYFGALQLALKDAQKMRKLPPAVSLGAK